MIKRTVLIFCSLWNQVWCFSQNLVPNYSFEQYSTCPTTNGQINLAVPWFQPNQGTSDYYNQCSGSINASVPHNFFGDQNAATGVAYAGIHPYFQFDYREYLEAELTSKLIAGKKYCCSFYVNSSSITKYGIKELGMYFSSDSVLASNFLPLNYTPQIEYSGNPIMDTTNWVQISGNFIASGGEKFVTIGNFHSNTATTLDSNSWGMPNWRAAYYFIDDISVTCCDTSGNCDPPISQSNYFVPSAFSPNGDGFNDELFVHGQNIKDIHFTVYDRWGEKVFETLDISKGWDGTFQGEKLNNAIFVYYLTLTYTDGKTENIKGDISLIR